MLFSIYAGIVILLGGLGGGYAALHNTSTPAEILLEPKADIGPEPFTDPISAVPTPEATATAIPVATPTAAPTAAPTAVATPRPTAAPPRLTPRPAPIGAVDANYRVYAGSNQACDKSKLVAFLQSHPSQAAAWAAVENITVAQIPSYIAGLTSTVLAKDVRITNNGFAHGEADPRQSVLQAGTAVLVDSRGVPVSRCLCGNPLLPAQPIQGTTTPAYRGTPWPNFIPGKVVPITQPAIVDALANPSPTAALPGVTQTPSGTANQSGSPFAEPNSVQDGGFESGIVPPWGTGSYEPRPEVFWGAANATATVDTTVAHTGKASLKIVNQSPAAPNVYRTMAQQDSVIANAPYCLAFYARSQNSASGILSIAVDHAWSKRSAASPGTYDWTRFQLSFTAESSMIDVRIISENTGTIWVDDISVTLGPCRA